jgi:hypothetical protein
MSPEWDSDRLKKLLKEHLEASTQFIDSGDYPRLTVQANRMITDATLWGFEKNLVLPGLILRLASMDIAVVMSPKPPNFAIEFPENRAVLELIKEIKDLLASPNSDEIDSRYWKAYETYYATFWESARRRIEGRIYTINSPLVDEAFKWNFNKMKEWKNLLIEIRGAPVQGIVNELNRIMHAHGANARQLACHGAAQTFLWWYSIISWKYSDNSGNVNYENVKDQISSIVEKISQSYGIRENDLFREITEISHSLLTEWRSNLISYYDYHAIEQKQGIPLRFEAKHHGKTETPKGKRAKNKE